MKKLLAVLLSAGMVGCATETPRENLYTLSGAVAGGLLGSQIGGGTGRAMASGGGAVLGAALGGGIGYWMDEVEHLKSCSVLD